MKRGLILILIVTLLAVVGYSWNRDVIHHNLVYRGESDSWHAEYRVKGKWVFTEEAARTEFASYVDGVLTITYEQEVETAPKVEYLSIFYDLGPGNSHVKEYHDTIMKKNYRIERHNTSVPTQNTVMKISIDLDGDVETFELTMKE
jgi:hypothetical protein